jgi:hypothetical protein
MITSADLSYNPRLSDATVQQILAYLPNLKAVNLAGIGMGQVKYLKNRKNSIYCLDAP